MKPGEIAHTNRLWSRMKRHAESNRAKPAPEPYVTPPLVTWGFASGHYCVWVNGKSFRFPGDHNGERESKLFQAELVARLGLTYKDTQ